MSDRRPKIFAVAVLTTVAPLLIGAMVNVTVPVELASRAHVHPSAEFLLQRTDRGCEIAEEFGGDVFAFASFYPDRSRVVDRRLIAYTRIIRERRLNVSYIGNPSPLTEVELADVQAQVFDRLIGDGMSERVARQVFLPSLFEKRIRWQGVYANGLVVVLPMLVLFLIVTMVRKK